MKKQQALIIGILLLVVAVFFYPVFKGDIPFPGDLLVGHYFPYNSLSYNGFAPGGVPNKAQGPDVIRQLYPWKHFVITSFAKGDIPFWNPYNFSGNPLLANFQSAVFYPLNILFFIMSFNLAWTLFIAITPLLAAWFTYLYLQEIGLKKVPGIFASIVFAFSSYMVVWMEYGNIGHTLVWLPLSLWLTEKLIKKFHLSLLMGLIATLTMAVLGGYIQGYFYIVAMLGVYIIFKIVWLKTRHWQKIFGLLLACIIPVFLTFFQFLPTLQLFTQSSRGNYSLEAIDKLLNPWWYAITVIAPDFFGHPATRNYWFYGTYIERVSYFGVIPLVFAIAAMITFSKRKETVIFASVFIATFLLSFNILVTKFFYLIPIPVISTTVPTRILCLFVFSGAILAGIGLDNFLRDQKQKAVYLGLGLCGSILVVGWLMVLGGKLMMPGQDWLANLSVSKRNLLIPSALLVCSIVIIIAARFKQKIMFGLVLVLCLLTLGDLFWFFQKITPFSPSQYVYPPTPIVSYLQRHAGIDRYWGYGSASVDTNFQMMDQTYIPDGNDPLHVRAYTEFLSTSKDGTIPSLLPRPDATIAPGYGQEDLKLNPYRQKILNILGVKYIVHKFDGAGPVKAADELTFPTKLYRLAWQLGPYQIYENLQAAPRAFLTADYQIITDKKVSVAKFHSKSFNERKTIIVSEDPQLKRATLIKNNVAILSYQPNSVVIKTNADADAMLFLSDTMYPGWNVTVDGKQEKIFTADYAFRAVRVGKGIHVVRFYYVSEGFKIGLMVSGICLFGLLIAYSIGRKYQK